MYKLCNLPETSAFSFAQITALSIVFQVLIVLGMFNFGLGHNLLYCRWHPAVQKAFHMQIASRILDWLETDHPLLEYYKFLGEQVHHPRMSSCKKKRDKRKKVDICWSNWLLFHLRLEKEGK